MIGTSKDQVIHYSKLLNEMGWFPGNSGGLALMSQKAANHKTITITPDNVPKRFLKSGDLFELKWMFDKQDFVLPSLNKNTDPHLIARWAQIYLLIITRSNAKCVIEVAAKWPALASRLATRAWERNATTYPNQLRLAHWELASRLSGEEEITLPIIDREFPDEMQTKISKLFDKTPKLEAVIIRDYGLLIWGESAEEAIAKLETFDELCQLQVQEFRLLGRL